jgi:hypothetical protein
VCLIPRPKHGLTRNHGYSFATASGRTRPSKPWSTVSKTTSSCVASPLTPHKLQPCDVGVFSPLKAAYRDQVERLYRGGVINVGKEHFTSLYSPARERALTSRNIKAAWAASGLFPFNPDRVLRDTPKPVQLTIPKAYELEVGSCPQGEVLQTPVTPVTSEALTLLHNLITQDAHALDETSKQRLQRHVQKLANAAQISFAERALLRDQTRFLSRMNNEAKVRDRPSQWY